MRYRKLLAGFLSLSIIILSCGLVFAMTEEASRTESVREARYLSFTGTVTEIRDRENPANSKFVSLESKTGQPANVIVSDHTYIFEDADIKVGSLITIYYDATKPMILIYPPQYSAEVIVVENQERNVKFDIFDGNLVSSDNFLRLKLDEVTKIISLDGKPYTGTLEKQKLIVVYGVATKSIPAQTRPDKIIVLSENDVREVLLENDVSKMKIYVNGLIIDSPSAYSNEQGIVMVPLRAIAEALGYDVYWNSSTRGVTIGKGISLTIGKDYYSYMRMSPIYLGTAPELVDSTTYVPLSFFNELMMVDKTDILEGRIVIGDKTE